MKNFFILKSFVTILNRIFTILIINIWKKYQLLTIPFISITITQIQFYDKIINTIIINVLMGVLE